MKGCPQGGVLSPPSLVVDGLLAMLNRGLYQVQGYSTNIVLAVQVKKIPEKLTHITNDGLWQLVIKCKRENLRLNTSLLLAKGRTFCKLRINYELVAIFSKVKYVGGSKIHHKNTPTHLVM